jgi:hypothetical protein
MRRQMDRAQTALQFADCNGFSDEPVRSDLAVCE